LRDRPSRRRGSEQYQSSRKLVSRVSKSASTSHDRARLVLRRASLASHFGRQQSPTDACCTRSGATKCDRIDKELAAIAANDPGAKVKFMDLTEQRRVAGQRLSELVDTID
jgi:hypothetical protein